MTSDPTREEEGGLFDLTLENYLQISTVTERLFLSGAPDLLTVRVMRCLRIFQVVNVAREVDDAPVLPPEVRGVHVPLDDGQPIPPERLTRLLNVLRGMERHGRVLVHCGLGVSRSPMVLACYLCARERTHSIAAGFDLLRSVRPSVNPSPQLRTPEVDEVVEALRRRWSGVHCPRPVAG